MVQRWLRVTVADFSPPENEIASRFKSNTATVWRHRLILGIASVLVVDHRSHALERCHHFAFSNNPVVKPIGDVLT